MGFWRKSQNPIFYNNVNFYYSQIGFCPKEWYMNGVIRKVLIVDMVQ